MKKISSISCLYGLVKSPQSQLSHPPPVRDMNLEAQNYFSLSLVGKYYVKCVKSSFHWAKTEVQVSYLGGSFRVLCSGRRAEKATRSPRSVTLCKHSGSRLQTTSVVVLVSISIISITKTAYFLRFLKAEIAHSLKKCNCAIQ